MSNAKVKTVRSTLVVSQTRALQPAAWLEVEKATSVPNIRNANLNPSGASQICAPQSLKNSPAKPGAEQCHFGSCKIGKIPKSARLNGAVLAA
jgi:hypothetical protein